MVEKVEKRHLDRAKNEVKNTKSGYIMGGVSAAAALSLFLMSQCPPQTEGPKTCDAGVQQDAVADVAAPECAPCPPRAYLPVRNDGNCEQSEAYPYLMDDKGNYLLDEKGEKIRNPYYSKEDCHDGDLICDVNLTQVLDRELNTVVLLDADGKPMELQAPLESADPNAENFSLDCAHLNCARLQVNTDYFGLLQFSQEQLSSRHADPADAGVEEGDNYFVHTTKLRAVCTGQVRACDDPLVEGPCLCPTNPGCVPEEGCGNHKLDPGEDCDPSSRRPSERTCEEDYTCVACHCVEEYTPVQPPPPPPPVVNPTEIPDCPPSIATSAGDLQSAIGRALTRNATTIRPLLGASAEQSMTFRFTFVAAPDGSLTFRSDSATIAGSPYQGGADIWSALGLNASNYSVGETNLQYPCKFSRPGTIQAEGQK